MVIRWIQPLPRLVALAAVIFGAAGIVGAAVTERTALIFPEVLVGATWAVFGWKGYPLIPCNPSGGSSNGWEEGRRIIRRRRVLAMVVPLLWFIITGTCIVPLALSAFRPDNAAALVLSTSMLPAAFIAVFAFTECPRCRKHFLLRRFRASWGSRCQHCGLPLHAAKHTT
jgi:hypothetical protein